MVRIHPTSTTSYDKRRHQNVFFFPLTTKKAAERNVIMSSSAAPFDIPVENLTQELLEQWYALPTDRQRFVGALQTETRVRATKVQ